jgi:hypothetical protein
MAYYFLLSIDSEGVVDKHDTRILDNILSVNRTTKKIRGGGMYQRFVLGCDRAISLGDVQASNIDSVFVSSFLLTMEIFFPRVDDERRAAFTTLVAKNKFNRLSKSDTPIREEVVICLREFRTIFAKNGDVQFDTIQQVFAATVQTFAEGYSRKVVVHLPNIK